MKLTATTIVESKRIIVDADICEHMTVVLLKSAGECIVSINDENIFSVSPRMHMLRIVGSALALYDGELLHFYTLTGICTQSVFVGRHVRHIEPMKEQVAITYTDQGVYDETIGNEVINVVLKDGTLISKRAFAEQHLLQYDICIAKVKPYACLSYNQNAIIHFNEQFDVIYVTPCPFETGNVRAMSYHYPHYLLIEENRFIRLHEDGSFEAFEQSFSYGMRAVMHRGNIKFLDVCEHRVVGYY